jgi:hypothetical protein
MKHFDHIKNKLREDQSLPNEFSWENSKAGIFAKMAARTEASGGLSLFTKLLASLGLIAILLFVVLVMFTKDISTLEPNFGDSTKSMSLADESSYAEIVSKTGELLKTSNTLKENKKSISSNTISNNPKLNNNTSGSFPSLGIQEYNSLTNEISKELNKQLKTANINDSAFQTEGVDIENSMNNIESEKLNYSVINDVLSTNQTEKTKLVVYNIQRLDKLTFNGIDFVSTAPELNFFKIESFTPIRKAPVSSPFAIELGFGINYLNQNFGNSMASQERDQYESGNFGHSASLRLRFQLKKNISISSGIEWRELYSKFDAEFVNSYEEILEDQLLEVQKNPYSSEDVLIYGDTLVTITETRKIVHHNRYKQFAIPLVLNYINKYKNFEFGFGIGALFLFSNETSGRTIQSGELMDYDGASQSIYKKNIGLSILAEISANYSISKHLYVGGRLNFSKGFKDWSATEAISLKPSISSGQLVVGYNF